MQIELMKLSMGLKPGQSIVVQRHEVIAAAAQDLDSRVFDSVRQSDVDKFIKKIEVSWGLIISYSVEKDCYIFHKYIDSQI